MKTTFTLAAFFFLLGTCFGDIIYLKSGRQIECESAWEEGKEVKYKISNGIVGIPKSIVAKIVKSEVKPPEVVIPDALKAQTQTAPAPSSSTIKNLETQTQSDPTLKPRLAKMYTSAGLTCVQKKD